MLGYQPAAPVTFDPVMTILSILIAIAGTGAGFLVAADWQSRTAAIVGGSVIGLSVAAMHYTGMFAYRVEGLVSWDQTYLTASLVLAVIFGALAMVFAGRWEENARKHIATALLVICIVSLHFTGMAAFQVAPMPGVEPAQNAGVYWAMALSITAVGLVIVGTSVSNYLIDCTRAESDQRLRHMAMHDALTGLPNRASFNVYLDRLLGNGQLGERQLAVIGIDLNRFKEINDAWGHSAGDMTLCALADRLRALAGPMDYVARLGGDEFCAATPFHSESELHLFVSRLEEAMHRPLTLENFECSAGASIGVAVHPRDGEDRESLTSNADLAMYRAKSDPAQNTCYYDTVMGDAVRDQRNLASDLRDAIGNDELRLHYQVQTSLTTGDITGYEALLRWTHPGRGPIPPAEFIPLAEANGLILALGEWVLRRACGDAALWSPSYKVSVNLSAVQLAHPGLPQLVHEVLLDSGLAPKWLELELTETALVKDKIRSLHAIRQIKALGVSIALDDFGTGYSSLDTLRTFPFDKIKLDRSFIEHVGRDAQTRAIVRAVMALGKSLSIPVLAEGIETAEQLSLLKREACDEAQGYLLGRPIPVADLAKQGGPLLTASETPTKSCVREVAIACVAEHAAQEPLNTGRDAA